MRLTSSLSIITFILLFNNVFSQEVLNLSASANIAEETAYSIVHDDILNCTYIAGSINFELLGEYSSDQLLTQNFPFGTIANSNFNNVQSLGSGDAFIAKINADNSIAWITTAGGADSDFYKNITIDREGNLVVVGALSLPCTFYNADGFVDESFTTIADHLSSVVCRYSPDGNLIWANFLTSDGDNVASAVASTPSSIVISGNFRNSSLTGSSSVNFFGFPIDETDTRGSFIAFFDYAGNCTSFKSYLSSNYDYSLVQPESLGNQLVFNNEKIVHCQFIPDQELQYISSENLTPELIQNADADNLFLRCFTADGSEIWSTHEAFSESLEIKSDPSLAINCDHVYVTFSFLGDQTTATVLSSYQDILSGEFPNIVLSKHSLLDGAMEAITILSSDDASSSTMATSIDTGETGTLYLSGVYQGNISFGSTNSNPPTSISEEGWIAAFDLNLTYQWSFTLSGNLKEAIMDIDSGNFSTIYFCGASSSNQINNLIFSLPAGSLHATIGKLINSSDNVSTFDILCPPDVIANSTSECGAEGVVIEVPTVLSDCYLDFLTNDAPSFYPLGNTTITHQATSQSGQTRQCTQLVTINDISNPPDIECSGTLFLESSSSSCTAFGTPALPTINGFCEPPEITNNITGNALLAMDFPLGQTSITWSVTTELGEVLECTSTVEVADITPPQALCSNAELTLDAQGNASLQLLQINNESFDLCGNILYDVSQEDFTCEHLGLNVITLTVTDEEGNNASCEAEVLVLENNDAIVLNAGEDFEICADQLSFDLSASSNSSSTNWSGGSGAFDNPSALSTTYVLGPNEFQLENITLSISAPSASGCSVLSDEIFIEIDQFPKIDIIPQWPGCIGETVNLTPLFSNASSVEWSSSDIEFNENINNENNAVTVPLSSSIGQVFVINIAATSILEVCNPVDIDITITAEECAGFEAFTIPTGFSPNGDQINDTFFINQLALHSPLEIYVYNRWGFLVYSSENYSNDWNGTDLDGIELPIDSYFAIISGNGLPQATYTITINR